MQGDGMGVSSIDLQHYLKGVHYPSRKDGLILKARENEAPQDVIDLLQNLPDWEFHSITDIGKAMREIR
jgi:hypothetical protein